MLIRTILFGRWRKEESSLFPRLCTLCLRVSGEPLKKDSPTHSPPRAWGRTWDRSMCWKQLQPSCCLALHFQGNESCVFDYFALITSGCSLLEAVSFPRNLFCFSSLVVFWGPASSLSPPPPSPGHPSPHLLLHHLLAYQGNKLILDPS